MTSLSTKPAAAQTAAPTLAFRLKNFALGGVAGMCATCCVSETINFIRSNFIYILDSTNRHDQSKNLSSFRRKSRNKVHSTYRW